MAEIKNISVEATPVALDERGKVIKKLNTAMDEALRIGNVEPTPAVPRSDDTARTDAKSPDNS